jgi:hypothetical protein
MFGVVENIVLGMIQTPRIALNLNRKNVHDDPVWGYPCAHFTSKVCKYCLCEKTVDEARFWR